MIRNEITEMSTRQYAEYISKLTGKTRSPAAVSNDCRRGKLDCYQEVKGGDYRIIVKKTVVPIEEYNELKAAYERLLGSLRSIRSLTEGVV